MAKKVMKKATGKTSGKPAKKPAAKAAKKPAPAQPAKKEAPRLSWFDQKTKAPLIDKYARHLDTFLQTMADGVVDDSEMAAQEGRLVDLMREIELKLKDDMHEKVTRLLCELTAYDIMRLLHEMQQARPRVEFRG